NSFVNTKHHLHCPHSLWWIRNCPESEQSVHSFWLNLECIIHFLLWKWQLKLPRNVHLQSHYHQCIFEVFYLPQIPKHLYFGVYLIGGKTICVCPSWSKVHFLWACRNS